MSNDGLMTRQEMMPAVADMLRRLVIARQSGREPDPWLPFPQNACSFSFGVRKAPLPIGALFVLWDCGHPFVQPCPDCGEKAYMVSFGGLLSAGGGKLACTGCAQAWFHFVGGMSRVFALIDATPLRRTQFRATSGLFGGAIASNGEGLRAALAAEMPPDMEEAPSVRVVNSPNPRSNARGHNIEGGKS